MKRLFPLLLVVLSISTLARADNQIQSAQQALKDQGFYYGAVDGQGGPETDAAIRRYQIRQGLEVTGKLDSQTLSSLNLGGGAPGDSTVQAVPPAADPSANAQPAPPPPMDQSVNAQPAPPPADVVQSDHDILRSQPQPVPASPPASDDQPAPQAPARVPDDQSAPQSQAPIQPFLAPAQPDVGQSVPPQYAQFFRKTPYETAPPVVQRGTVQQAQARLAREGFYRGIVDGQLSDNFSRALAAYQRDADLRQSGRLDMDTLSDMNLLPRRHVLAPPPVTYGAYGYPAPGPVYRGIWVH